MLKPVPIGWSMYSTPYRRFQEPSLGRRLSSGVTYTSIGQTFTDHALKARLARLGRSQRCSKGCNTAVSRNWIISHAVGERCSTVHK